MEIVQAVKKLNSISPERLNFRRRPILCTTLYRNLMQVSNFGGTFDQLFLWIFLWNFHRICLYLCYTMVQKSQKWPKTQIKGGGGVLPAGQPPEMSQKVNFSILRFFLFYIVQYHFMYQHIKFEGNLTTVVVARGLFAGVTTSLLWAGTLHWNSTGSKPHHKKVLSRGVNAKKWKLMLKIPMDTMIPYLMTWFMQSSQHMCTKLAKSRCNDVSVARHRMPTSHTRVWCGVFA